MLCYIYQWANYNKYHAKKHIQVRTLGLGMEACLKQLVSQKTLSAVCLLYVCNLNLNLLFTNEFWISIITIVV